MFHCANSHFEMQLNDIIIVSVMVSDAYTIADTNPILPKMADTDISIWYQCIPSEFAPNPEMKQDKIQLNHC